MPRKVLRPGWIASVALAGALPLPSFASALTLQCLPRGAIVDRLKDFNGEAPAHAGLASNGALLEVTVGPDGSWTAFFTFPDGKSCPIAVGEGWRPAAGEEDDDPAA